MKPIARRWSGVGIAALLFACADRDLIIEERSLVAGSGIIHGVASTVVDASAPTSACDGGASDDPACEFSRIDECGPACADLPRDPTLCGDGRVALPEECDDGNAQSFDGCSSMCRAELCGNGRVDPPEECDDGNDESGDGCSGGCLSESCGNARLERVVRAEGPAEMETCDPPEAGVCDERCQMVDCGDGRRTGDEACDDGNTTGGDGCSRVCTFEYCGDGEVNQLPGDEQCDPPDSDVCDESCQVVECGNGGPLQGSEACDDGNVEPGDGCDAACRVEVCGDGKLDVGEDCEPPGEGRCSVHCTARRVECGDGVIDDVAGEECDDGNIAYGDGCSPSCVLEQCGNGRLESPFETCEPPGTLACSQLCRAPVCGDGWFDEPGGEECEDGNRHAGDGCGVTCRLERCGNGELEIGEHCDPPDTDGCGPSCQFVATGIPRTTPLPVGAEAFSPDETDVAGSRLSAAGVERASRAWCVRTAPGARYRWGVTASLFEPDAAEVSALLGARFFPESACSGGMLGGFSSRYPIERSDGSELMLLPPASPIADVDAGFEAPPDVGSMQLWVGVQGPPVPATLTLEDIELVRLGMERCGDGFPEGSEQCEANVTPECSSECTLPVVCGDGWAVPGECGAGACPSDCGLEPPVCGDGVVVAPEECDPAGVDQCRDDCTLEHPICGDGRVEDSESCDPPDGAGCDESCQEIECGNGVIESPEECEPPDSNGCSQHCRTLSNQEASCGDGLLQGAESCDPPNPDTWCSPRCQRIDPRLTCGDGWVDSDAGEECDPPGPDEDCGLDCKWAVCGDGTVAGRELCDPPDGEACGDSCQPQGDALQCQLCLSEECRGEGADDAFQACFGLEGAAQTGPAVGSALRQLCVDAVECMRRTGCAAESQNDFVAATPVACFCGKSVLDAEDGIHHMRSCRDGVEVPEGACSSEFARAAQSAQPGAVLAALDPDFSTGALSAAVRLMSECGHDEQRCGEVCSTESECGNGVLEPGELCDPELDEHCNEELCSILPCGNGVVDVAWPYGPGSNFEEYAQPEDWVAESCDILDPYTNQEGRCDSTCQLIVTCGDGVLVPSVEACDPGADGDWSDCCQPDNAAQLAGCDRDGDRVLDRNEQCQAPSVCGNGRREGTEECDPEVPDPERCVDCRAVDPCTECTRRECASAHDGCYGSGVEPRTRVGCGEVLECVATSGCAKEGPYGQSCRCGSTELAECALLGGNGPCQDVITQNAMCEPVGGSIPQSCVTANGSNPQVPAGAAFQIANCRQALCSAECDYWGFPTVEE
jgi:cysteine-rich repeat protein